MEGQRLEDSYTVREAARVLGISDRRVRQLLESGELEGRRDDNGAWRLYQRSVHARLEDRPARTRGKRSSSRAERPTESPESVREWMDRVIALERENARLEARAELTEQAESTVRESLERERERADRLEQELREARERLEERAAPWWRRLFGE